VLFICTPINVILENSAELKTLPRLKHKLIVSDIGSTKFKIMESAKEAFAGRKDIVFIGGHPMCGNEFNGIDALDSSLFKNATYVFTPTEDCCNDDIAKMIRLARASGANPMLLDAKMHDKAAAGISHLPQMMATGLVDLVSKLDNLELSKALCAGGFRDTTRIASSQYKIWNDIVDTNRENILELINSYIEELSQIKHSIEDGSLKPIFDNANAVRNSIPPKGAKYDVFKLSVKLDDKAGELFKITKMMNKRNFVIKEVDVAESDDVFEFGFMSEDEMQCAAKLLHANGYIVTVE